MNAGSSRFVMNLLDPEDDRVFSVALFLGGDFVGCGPSVARVQSECDQPSSCRYLWKADRHHD